MAEILKLGGPVMWVFLALSVAAGTVFVERLFHLHRAQIRTGDFLQGIHNVLRRGNMVEAVSLCEMTPGPVAHIARAALLAAPNGREGVRDAVRNAGLTEIARLEHRLNVLSVIARLAPMLGLLGTVLGLMDAALVLQRQAPLIHAGDLSAPLWRALLNTAAGLTVAIPCFAAYNILVGRVERILLDMEQAGSDLISRSAELSGSREKRS
jgi:biopolymer transport protein ExbB